MTRSAKPPTIRLARPDDYEALNRIAALSDVQIEAPEGPGRPYVDRLFADGTVLIAERDGLAVGFAAAVWIRPAPGTTTVRRSHVSDLFVDPAAQGSGVGGQHYRALLEAHREERWSVSSSGDPRAQALYAKGGMTMAWPLYYLERPSGRADQPLPRVRATVRPLGWAEATAATAEISGFDRTLDIRTWSSRAGATPFSVDLDGSRALVGFARDHSHRPGRRLDAAFIDRDADPQAALVAALASDALAGGGALGLCLGAPHPALWTLLGSGFHIAELDTWFETPGGLMDPARVVPDPSVG